MSAAAKEFPAEKPEGCRSLCLKNLGEATEEDVHTFLDECSVQSVRMVCDRRTGSPRGIAFVDFKTEAGVDDAMARNGKKINGLKVEMHYEAPRERPRPEGCLCVAVKKLPPETKDNDLRKLFRGLKSLKDVRVIRDSQQNCTGLGFAEFDRPKDVERAVQRDGMKVNDSVVFICYETKVKKSRPDWVDKIKESKAKKKQLQAKDEQDNGQEGEEEATAQSAGQKKQKAKKSKTSAEQLTSQDGEVGPAEAENASPKQGTKRKLLEKGTNKKKLKKRSAGEGEENYQQAAEEAQVGVEAEEGKKKKGKKKRKAA